MKTPLKEILNELKKHHIFVQYYTVSSNPDLGEYTIIVRTPSIRSVKYSTQLEEKIWKKFSKKFPNWDLIIVPIGNKERNF